MMIAHGTLVMAVDGEKMLLLRNEGDEKFTVLDTVTHAEIGNPPSRALGSDAPGRTFASTRARRSAYETTDLHDQAEERFAIACAHGLEQAAKADGAGIVVIAPPRTLSQLRKHWGRVTKAALLAEICKDLVHHEWDDIARAIADHHYSRERA